MERERPNGLVAEAVCNREDRAVVSRTARRAVDRAIAGGGHSSWKKAAGQRKSIGRSATGCAQHLMIGDAGGGVGKSRCSGECQRRTAAGGIQVGRDLGISDKAWHRKS